LQVFTALFSHADLAKAHNQPAGDAALAFFAWTSSVQLHARIAGLLSLHITAEPHPGAPSRLHCTAQVRGVVLINGAGKFDDLDKEGPEQSTDEVSVTLTGEVAQKVCCRCFTGDLCMCTDRCILDECHTP